MTSTPSTPTDHGAGKTLTLTRTFDAPRELVWTAWTDPAHLARWWGPHAFSNPRCEFEARPGGRIHIDMRGPDGTVYPMTGKVEEASAPERLVFTASALDASGTPVLDVHNVLTLEERGGRTTMTLEARVMRVDPSAVGHVEGMDAGWAQSLERLEAVVTPVRSEVRDRELVLSRTYNAPPERVWKLWTEPAHLARWWGPRGFTTTTHAMDLRPGGVWRYTMHGPDGTDYENRVTYIDVEPARRLTFHHDDGSDDERNPVCHEHHASFEAVGAGGAQTRVTMRTAFQSKEALEFVAREFGAIEGGKQHLSRLGEFLEEERRLAENPRAIRPFRIARAFDAPRELVYQVWTEREHMMRWFGPKGMTVPRCTLDLRPGGTFHYAMQAANGSTMWGLWRFREVVPGERLVFVSMFSDEQGREAPCPFDETWPRHMLSTITFADHAGKGGGTTVEIEWAPIDATDAERATFEAARPSMNMGWGGTLDKLAEHLASMERASA